MQAAFASGVRVVGVDGDDTLWRCQEFFDLAQSRLQAILSPWAPGHEVTGALHDAQARNLPLYGYGVKGWTLSTIEVALQVSGGAVPGRVVSEVVALGRDMLAGPVLVLDGAREALQALARSHRVVLVTKGDLVDQRRKLAASGLADCFDHVEIVPEKDPATYGELLEFLRCPPREFLMVGNSEVSDIAPVLALGGWAVHVPFATTWAHEHAEPVEHDRRVTVGTLADVPGLLAGSA